MRLIKDWIAKLNSMNVVKNILIQPIIQIVMLVGVYNDKINIYEGIALSFLILPAILIMYLVLAWIVDKLKVRQHIESEDYKRTYTWPKLYERLDQIEKKIDNIKQA